MIKKKTGYTKKNNLITMFLRKEMPEIKQKRRKPAIILGVVMILLYMGIKYARELFFIDKFDENEKCEANELAEFFPPKDKEDEY